VLAEAQPDAGVRRRAGRVEQQRAGHAQVHEQVRVVLELPDEVLAAPREPLDGPAFDGRRELVRGERPRPALVEHLEGLEGAPLDMGRQIPPDGLDLRELRHGASG
jgi:hypothetical protein